VSLARHEFSYHIERLRHLAKQLKLCSGREYLEVDEVFLSRGKEICRYKKQLSKFKDSQILSAAKGAAYHGIAIDSTLDAMVSTFGVDAFGLLEQSSEEVRNTDGYSCQTEQNILYPVLTN
jgi:hypothetical protein